jgi:hypothetical protein
VLRPRWWEIGVVDRVAVLRGADQRAGRTPRRCVKTGVPTDGAVRLVAVALRHADIVQRVVGFALTRAVAWLLRRPSFVAVISVSPQAWQRHQRSLLGPTVIGSVGAALIGFGIVADTATATVFGTLVLVVAAILRWRATRRWWIGLRFDPDRDHIVVSPASRRSSTTKPGGYSSGRLLHAERWPQTSDPGCGGPARSP